MFGPYGDGDGDGDGKFSTNKRKQTFFQRAGTNRWISITRYQIYN